MNCLVRFNTDSGPMGLNVFVLVKVLCNHKCGLFLPLYEIYALWVSFLWGAIVQYICFSF